MKRLYFIFFLIFCTIIQLVSTCSCQASDMDIYIRNKPYTGQVVMRGTDICITLDDFAKFMKLNLHQKENSYCLTDPSKGDANCCLENGAPGLYVNGEKFSDIIQGKDGKMFVPLQKISKAVGAMYSANESTGIIDVTFARKGVTQQEIIKAQSEPVTSNSLTLVYYYFDG